MQFIRKYLLCLLVFISGTGHAQYALPTNFVSADSTTIQGELTKFASHVALHLSDTPGFVFQMTQGYPRVQFFYQHTNAFTGESKRYVDFPSSGVTNTGIFTGIGDITPNLQVIMRYNPMRLSGEVAVFNGFGARYRTAGITDSLRSLALGVMVQKLSGTNIAGVKILDFSMQYGHYAGDYIFTGDVTASFINGNLSIEKLLGEQFDGTYEKRVFHGGIGVIRRWNHWSLGVKIRSTGTIWASTLTIGWGLPSRN